MTATPSPTLDILPLGLRITGRRAVLVGGGPVSARRAQTLADAGAHLVLVAPAVSEEMAALVAAGTVAWEHQREYARGEIGRASCRERVF